MFNDEEHEKKKQMAITLFGEENRETLEPVTSLEEQQAAHTWEQIEHEDRAQKEQFNRDINQRAQELLGKKQETLNEQLTYKGITPQEQRYPQGTQETEEQRFTQYLQRLETKGHITPAEKARMTEDYKNNSYGI